MMRYKKYLKYAITIPDAVKKSVQFDEEYVKLKVQIAYLNFEKAKYFKLFNKVEHKQSKSLVK